MKPWIWFAGAMLAAAFGIAGAGERSDPPFASPMLAAQPGDPALLRREILARLDASIDAQSAQAHLNARLAVDQAMPIPYLGLDLETVEGGAKVIGVYAETAAEIAGLKTGDVIRAVAGAPIESKGAVGRELRKKPVGAPLVVTIERAGAKLDITATPTPRPEEDEDEEEQFPDLPPRVVLATAPLRLGAQDLGNLVEALLGGHGRPSRWSAVSDGGKTVIRQEEADKTGIRFPIGIVRGFVAGDVIASAKFRYDSGVVDRAAGIVIRYQDPGNYIVARANQGESDLRIFRVANGVRRTLPGGIVKVSTDDTNWHMIELRAEGPKLTATIDGYATTTSYDSLFLTGRVGLWTKSDAVTDFDDVVFTPIARAESKPAAGK